MKVCVTTPSVRRHFAFERRSAERRRVVEFTKPFGRRHFGHAAEQALFGTRAHEEETIRAHRDERRTAAQRAGLLLGLAREALLIAALARRA